MEEIEKYLKIKSKKYTRASKVTSVNLESYQVQILHEENINISYLIRELLDDFLISNFPKKIVNYKKKIKGDE